MRVANLASKCIPVCFRSYYKRTQGVAVAQKGMLTRRNCLLCGRVKDKKAQSEYTGCLSGQRESVVGIKTEREFVNLVKHTGWT